MESAPATLVETHVSWVAMLGDRVYKLKKPVRTGFLDFSTVEARQRACEEEVRVNSRLAPDVYLGVDTLTDDHGVVVDHLVVMRRMPSDRRLTTLIEAGLDVDDAVRSVAHQVAALHLAGTRSAAADRAGSAAATLARWEANADEIEGRKSLLLRP